MEERQRDNGCSKAKSGVEVKADVAVGVAQQVTS
jgi:hypothetical protein